MTYPSFEAAQRRVEVLKGSGIWPGIRYPDAAKGEQ